jgi:hypothetical protein
VSWRQRLARRVALDLFAGPSWFSVSQDVIDAVDVTEAYPYDEVTFAGTRVSRATGSVVGFEVGVDVVYRLTAHLGVGGGVRLARATAGLRPSPERRVDVDAGGAFVSAGLRLGF